MKSRAWTFTTNNYTFDDIYDIVTYATRYIIFGFEIAPETGTPHMQGYLYHQEPVRLSHLKKYFPKSHFEIAHGTPEQNRTYCSKSGEFYEFGECPSQGSASFDKIERAMENPTENFHLYHQYRKAYKEYTHTHHNYERDRHLYICRRENKYAIASDYSRKDVCMYPSDYSGQSVYVVPCYHNPIDIENWLHGYPVHQRVGYEYIIHDPDVLILYYDDAKEYRYLIKNYGNYIDAIDKIPTKKGPTGHEEGAN